MMGFGASCVFACTMPVVNSLYPEKVAYLNSFTQLCAGEASDNCDDFQCINQKSP